MLNETPLSSIPLDDSGAAVKPTPWSPVVPAGWTPASWAGLRGDVDAVRFLGGALIESYDPVLGLGTVVPELWYRVGLDGEDLEAGWARGLDTVYVEKLGALLREPRAREVRRLMLCDWGGDGLDEATFADSEALRVLSRGALALASLEELYIGEEPHHAEAPQAFVGHVGAALRAFPRLRRLEVRAAWMAWGSVSHTGLRSLRLEVADSPQELLDALNASFLPGLRSLEVWLGGDGGGEEVESAQLAPLLTGKLFPALETLRLWGHSGELGGLVEGSPLAARLTSLALE